MTNINAIKCLWEELRDRYSFKYLMTRRLTQDCLENLFGKVRLKGGCNFTPDAEKLKYSLRAIIVNSLLEPPESMNCEMDLDKFLSLKSNVERSHQSKPFRFEVEKEVVVLNGEEIPQDPHPDIAIEFDDLTESNAITYLAGWSSSFTCEECKKLATSPHTSQAIDEIHIMNKKYSYASSFLYPNDNLKLFGRVMFKIITDNIEIFIESNRKNLFFRLKESIGTSAYKAVLCQKCYDIVVRKFILVNINAHLKNINEKTIKIAARVPKKRNRKAQAVVHE